MVLLLDIERGRRPGFEGSGRSERLWRLDECQLAPAGAPVYNPAFGATPLELVTAITLERGIYRPPEMPDLG